MLSADELREAVEAVAKRGSLQVLRANQGRSQAFPGSMVDAIGGKPDELATGRLSWGFPAEWGDRTVFNTRIESALGGSAMWRDAFRDGRCVIPAASFFELHVTEKALSPHTGRLVKRPYEFADAAGLPLMMAGVSDGGHCSVVTTEPNACVSPIHSRMPLLLRFEEVPQWLEGDLAGIAALADREHYDLAIRPELELASAVQSQSGQLSLF